MKNLGPARHRKVRVLMAAAAAQQNVRMSYDYQDMMADRAWNLRNLGECPKFVVATCKDALRAARRIPAPALP